MTQLGTAKQLLASHTIFMAFCRCAEVATAALGNIVDGNKQAQAELVSFARFFQPPFVLCLTTTFRYRLHRKGCHCYAMQLWTQHAMLNYSSRRYALFTICARVVADAGRR